MKKELAACILLVLLTAGAGWSTRHMTKLADAMLTHLDSSESYGEMGDGEKAREELDEALSLWLRAEGYTHIFIRHPEIDAATDAFYELIEAQTNGDAGLTACFDKLRYHIMSIESMERLRLGSIL